MQNLLKVSENIQFSWRNLSIQKRISFLPQLAKLLIEKKEELRKYLANHGVETRNFFIPMHLQPIYKTKGKFPHSEYAMEHGIYLPSGLDLTEEKIDKICKLIKRSGYV